jgi:tRNA A-37 threonylcarbamoyl transferase component Bud32/tetratricopeptide (TPR) repeat protein
MVATRTDSIDFGDAPPGGGQGLAMRGQIATSLFGDVAQPVCIGRFEVLEEIGAGGMGVVYRARDPKLDRDAAIKVMHTEQVSARGRARLIREAQTLAKLNHPHVVTVYEVAEHEQQVFVAMEFVAGGNLRDWIRDDEPSRQEILARFLDAGRGLAAAHDAGIVHRDFKPANVLLGIDGRVRVADFGLARDDGSRETRDSQSGGVSASQSDGLTKTGMVIGTPAYMAPEQWARKSITAATDQFAYCMSLWEALAGVLPYEHGVVRAAAKSGELGAPRGADAIAGRVRKALLRGLRVDAGERWPNLGALVEALEPGRAAPWKGFAVVAVVAGVVGAAAASGGEAERLSSSPCDVARSRIEKVWSESESSKLRALYEDSAPFAKGSWTEIETGLERLVASWEGAASEICRGAPPDRAAVTCLEESAAELGSFTGRIGDPNASVVARLPSALASLEPASRCSSPTLASAHPLPPVAAPFFEQVGEARASAQEAALSLELGDFSRAEVLARKAVETARATGFQPVLAEARLVVAELEFAKGNAAVAAEHYQEALATAQGSRHDEAVLRAVAGFLRAMAHSSASSDDLKPWVSLAKATFERTPRSVGLENDLNEALLDVFRLTGERDDALRLARELSQRTDEETSFVARSWARRQEGHLLADLGRDDEAEAVYKGLLEETQARLGVGHPELAALHSAIGLLHLDDPRRAAGHFEQALEIIRVSLGRGDIAYARHALGLAQARAGLGELDEAKALAREAADLQLRLLPAGDIERNGALILLAMIADSEGKHSDSLLYWRQVLDVTSREKDPENYRMALNNVAFWLRMTGDLVESRPFYAKLRDESEPGTVLRDHANLGLAAYELRQQRRKDARLLLISYERPSTLADVDEFDLELWALKAILDGASEIEWESWEKAAVDLGAAWFVEEVRETRRAEL